MVEELLHQYGLAAVFAALVLAAFGLPVPEDLTLLLAGVLVGQGHATWLETALVGYFGILCSDTIAWAYGRKVGLHPKGFIARLVGPEDVAKIDRFYRRFGAWAIVIARVVPGSRIPAFFFAGASGSPWWRFIFIDASTAWLPVIVFVWLGAHFSDDFTQVTEHMEQVRNIGGALLVAAVLFVAWRILRRQKQRLEKAGD